MNCLVTSLFPLELCIVTLHQCAFASSGKEAGLLSQHLLAQQQSALTNLLDPFVCVADVCSPDGSLCTTGSCPLAGAGNECNPDGQTHLCLTVFTADSHAVWSNCLAV